MEFRFNLFQILSANELAMLSTSDIITRSYLGHSFRWTPYQTILSPLQLIPAFPKDLLQKKISKVGKKKYLKGPF